MKSEDIPFIPPYLNKDGWLCYLKVEKNGETSPIRLCNFIPYIAAQRIVDDGAGTKVQLEIGAFDAQGKPMEPMTVPGEKFYTLDWLNEKWGFEYYLEVGNGLKEHVRHFLQTTAHRAEKTTIYAVTGWKQIGSCWQFLMPGDEKNTVKLEGRCNNYEFNRNDSLENVIATMALPYAVAPKEIMFPLVAFAFLSPLNSFLRKAQYEPKTVLMLCGKTGSKKSTLAALVCSFFGKFSTTELPLSFRDTANSIIRQSFALKDVLTVIDDYHPSTGRDASQMNTSAQAIFRAYGNRTGRGRLNANSELMTDRYPQGNAIITAEFPPDVGESGTARFIMLEIGTEDVNNEELTHYQQLAANGVLSSCMYQYTEWIKEKLLCEKTEDAFAKYLADFCKECRKELTEKGKQNQITLRDRLLDDMVSLHVGFSFFCDFLLDKNCIMPEAKPAMLEEFDAVIFTVAAKQQSQTEQEQPTHKFIRKLNALLESGCVSIGNRNLRPEYPIIEPNNLIGYEDDDYYYLNKSLSHKAVKRLCDEQGEGFAIPERGLLKALENEGFLICDEDGKHTRNVKIGTKVRHLMVISKAKFNEVLADER
ncbi:MAG: DUF927 domain-containing protein [Clostridia bacterium]|nr:DUF927 domain-containing protein [Clostridia bacterium]